MNPSVLSILSILLSILHITSAVILLVGNFRCDNPINTIGYWLEDNISRFDSTVIYVTILLVIFFTPLTEVLLLYVLTKDFILRITKR